MLQICALELSVNLSFLSICLHVKCYIRMHVQLYHAESLHCQWLLALEECGCITDQVPKTTQVLKFLIYLSTHRIRK